MLSGVLSLAEESEQRERCCGLSVSLLLSSSAHSAFVFLPELPVSGALSLCRTLQRCTSKRRKRGPVLLQGIFV